MPDPDLWSEPGISLPPWPWPLPQGTLTGGVLGSIMGEEEGSIRAWQKEVGNPQLWVQVPQCQLWHSPFCKPQVSRLVSKWLSPDPSLCCLCSKAQAQFQHAHHRLPGETSQMVTVTTTLELGLLLLLPPSPATSLELLDFTTLQWAWGVGAQTLGIMHFHFYGISEVKESKPCLGSSGWPSFNHKVLKDAALLFESQGHCKWRSNDIIAVSGNTDVKVSWKEKNGGEIESFCV